MTAVTSKTPKSAQLLDGKLLADRLKQQLKKEVEGLRAKTGTVPVMVNVMIGDDAGACAYANSQKKVAAAIGIEYHLQTLAKNISQANLLDHIKKLNADPRVNGIMIHKPVPKHIDYRAAANMVAVTKDLEGINVTNIGKMVLGETQITPCTPAAVMELLKASGVSLRGKETVVVGHSEIVGKPLSLLLLEEYATVTVCHIATSESGKLTEHIGRAEVLIVAVGKPALIKGEWIKNGAIVVDVGINQVDGQIVGDVEFEAASKKASFITPVPGGVGPVTVVMLMKNGIEAFKMQVKT